MNLFHQTIANYAFVCVLLYNTCLLMSIFFSYLPHFGWTSETDHSTSHEFFQLLFKCITTKLRFAYLSRLNFGLTYTVSTSCQIVVLLSRHLLLILLMTSLVFQLFYWVLKSSFEPLYRKSLKQMRAHSL